MKVNRRKFLQSTAATAAAGMFGSPAWRTIRSAWRASMTCRAASTSTASRWSTRSRLRSRKPTPRGGLLGRQIKLINYDTQSNMQLYTSSRSRRRLKDKVAVVHGGITSASREVIRPVLDRFKTLYFYNTQV